MKTFHRILVAACLALLTFKTFAAVLYVDANSISPTPPYAGWSTAAVTIQDAVDAATNGDLVLVTNGVYQSGGQVVYGSMSNRVAVTKAVTVQSVNGPAVTIIRGNPVPGDSAVRCVYLTNQAALNGFTLTNGATRTSGDWILEQAGGGVLCNSSDATVSNCVFTVNTANYGGGACQGTLNNCTLSGNSATYEGGGTYNSMLNNCLVSVNSAVYGGGASYGTLNNCVVMSNSSVFGGGASNCGLNNCLLSGNSAAVGGGSSYGTLNNCTLTLNSATTGGGVYNSTLNNCIVYFNSAPNGNNYWYEFPSLDNDSSYTGGYVNYSCTSPLPDSGTGNISADPQLTDTAHLGAASPCRGAGSADYVTGVDIDGESWASPPSMGCDEYHPGATGSLSVFIHAEYTNVAAGFPVNFTALITGHASSNHWNFADGTGTDNQPFFTSHSWAAVGAYPVVLTAYNDSNPGGVSATVMVSVVTQPVHYVALDSLNPVAPYTSWATAATNIQDAVDAASVPDSLVLVSNGIYEVGGRIVSGIQSNRVAMTIPLTLASLNGPTVTIIQGYPVIGDSAVRCVYMANKATLSGFTVTQGATTLGSTSQEQSGGGLYCESTNATVTNCIITGNHGVGGAGGACGGTLNNCVLSSNTANYYEYYGSGGGVWGAVLNNCLVIGNAAGWAGGGADTCTLNNCTVVSNSAEWSGNGVYSCVLNNCISYYNNSGDNYGSSTLNDCCTTPLPDSGTNNITSEPLFADLSGGDFRLQSNSPCINLGDNAFVSGTADLDGNPRIIGSAVDIGAYEIQTAFPLTAAIEADYTTGATGYPLNFSGLVLYGRATTTGWDFGDGTATNGPLAVSHSWAVIGDYPVVFTAFNASNPGGVSATVMVHVVTQPIHYVSLASTNPAAPYTSWDTAATNIQDAVDVASVPGALVLVSNGVYQAGERLTYDAQTNRLAVTRPVTVESVNGPAVTVIDGERAVRCVYLTNGTALTGFTLTNGATPGNGGGVYCESINIVVSNCMLVTNSAASGGGAYGGTLNLCTLSDNSAVDNGGGACSGRLNDCVINHNSANVGGGAYQGTLKNCVLTGNVAYNGAGADSSTLISSTVNGNTSSTTFNGSGGGLNNCTATGCTINSNYSWYGGGACGSTLTDCTLSDDNNAEYGGGAHASTLTRCVVSGDRGALGAGISSSTANDCLIMGNGASVVGGVFESTLNNCTITANWSIDGAGGAGSSTLNNCILYDNSLPYQPGSASYNYGSECTLNYSCTLPLPAGGTGNITNAPLFVNESGNDFHLQSNSPCINSGDNAFVTWTNDFEGNPRIRGEIVDIGAYEYQTPTSVISYAWLQQYGLPTDGSADFADTDGDGFNNWQEWRIGTSPIDALSLLKLTAVTNDGSGITVTWQSVSGIAYFVQRSTNLLARPAFQTIATDIAGQTDTTSYTDTDATGAGPYFYRVGVHSSRSGQWVQWTTAAGGNGHWYLAMAISSGFTWLQANELAQAAGGYLTTITSAAESDFVFSLIDSPAFFRGNGGNGAGPAIGGYWDNGNWFWVTAELWDYTSWAPNQPDNPGYETRLQYWSGTQGQPAPTWNDVNPDDSNTGGYIIERDTQPDTVH
jgi:hypothetical protein